MVMTSVNRSLDSGWGIARATHRSRMPGTDSNVQGKVDVQRISSSACCQAPTPNLGSWPEASSRGCLSLQGGSRSSARVKDHRSETSLHRDDHLHRQLAAVGPQRDDGRLLAEPAGVIADVLHHDLTRNADPGPLPPNRHRQIVGLARRDVVPGPRVRNVVHKITTQPRAIIRTTSLNLPPVESSRRATAIPVNNHNR